VKPLGEVESDRTAARTLYGSLRSQIAGYDPLRIELDRLALIDMRLKDLQRRKEQGTVAQSSLKSIHDTRDDSDGTDDVEPSGPSGNGSGTAEDGVSLGITEPEGPK
jgi:hypothetical protein